MRAGKGWCLSAAALLIGFGIAATSAEARFGRMGIHPNFGGGGFHGGGNIGGGGFQGGGTLSRPGEGGSGTHMERPDHGGMVGWDNASRGPPRPDPNPGPGPGPGPGPRPHPDPYPLPVPVPYPNWGPYWGWDDGWYDWGDDFAAGAVVGATVGAVAATAAASAPAPVGTVVMVLPANCVAVIVNNVSYDQCGSTWYQPQYAGTTIQYIVVTPPR